MSAIWRRGISRIHFVPIIAAQAAPTRAEIAAGTRLFGIAGIDGLSITDGTIDVPSMDSRTTPKIPGERTLGDASITFNDDTTPPPTRSALARGTSGYLVLMPIGDVATKRCEVWPVTTTGVNDEWDATGATPAKFKVGFAVTGDPEQNAVIPALT